MRFTNKAFLLVFFGIGSLLPSARTFLNFSSKQKKILLASLGGGIGAWLLYETFKKNPPELPNLKQTKGSHLFFKNIKWDFQHFNQKFPDFSYKISKPLKNLSITEFQELLKKTYDLWNLIKGDLSSKAKHSLANFTRVLRDFEVSKLKNKVVDEALAQSSPLNEIVSESSEDLLCAFFQFINFLRILMRDPISSVPKSFLKEKLNFFEKSLKKATLPYQEIASEAVKTPSIKKNILLFFNILDGILLGNENFKDFSDSYFQDTIETLIKHLEKAYCLDVFSAFTRLVMKKATEHLKEMQRDFSPDFLKETMFNFLKARGKIKNSEPIAPFPPGRQLNWRNDLKETYTDFSDYVKIFIKHSQNYPQAFGFSPEDTNPTDFGQKSNPLSQEDANKIEALKQLINELYQKDYSDKPHFEEALKQLTNELYQKDYSDKPHFEEALKQLINELYQKDYSDKPHFEEVFDRDFAKKTASIIRTSPSRKRSKAPVRSTFLSEISPIKMCKSPVKSIAFSLED